MKNDIERLRQLSLSCRKQARLASSEAAMNALIALADEYEEEALTLFKAHLAKGAQA